MSTYEPRTINVTVVGDGFYIAQEADGESLYVPAPADFNNLHDWTLNLDDTQLEAALQMYWDRWNFQSGDIYDKKAFDALEMERKRRRLPNSTFAPGIFR